MRPASSLHSDSRTGSTRFEPAYLALHRRGELRRRASAATAELERCVLCPRRCGADRLAGPSATCHTGRYARVASTFAHFGEEDCLRGWGGSGTIFFSLCSLRCVFCQNYDISQQEGGAEIPPEHLARLMLALQAQGCHNINLVTPKHVAPQILEALPIAVGWRTAAAHRLQHLGLRRAGEPAPAGRGRGHLHARFQDSGSRPSR